MKKIKKYLKRAIEWVVPIIIQNLIRKIIGKKASNICSADQAENCQHQLLATTLVKFQERQSNGARSIEAPAIEPPAKPQI